MRDAGLETPFGFEDLRDVRDLEDALEALRRERPGARRAMVKLNTSFWDEGRALVELPREGGRADLAGSLRQARLSDPASDCDAYLSRFSQLGGVVEEFVEGLQDDASVQIRINPLGKVFLTSTHDELRNGDRLLDSGCRFPADDAYRGALKEAGLRMGRLLAEKGLVSRLSVEFLVQRTQGSPRLIAREINLGVGGTTHSILAVRFLCGGDLDPTSGLFYSPHGRPKFYRSTDRLCAAPYTQFVPEDLVELLTLEHLNYSPHGERGSLFYMLGGVASTGRLGLLAIGNDREEADAVFARTVATLDRACGRVSA
jgi:PGM1 C-terminal domain